METVAPTYRRQVVRSFLWQGGGQFIGQTVSWISTVVVIRMLTPADYGLMAMAGVFLSLFFLVADLGFGAAAVQAKTIDREQLRRVFGAVLLTNGAGALLMLASAPFVSAFFEEPRLLRVMQVLSLNFVLIALYVLPQAQLVRELDFQRKARVDVGATIAGAVVALAMAGMGMGVWALVGGVLGQHAAKLIAVNIICPLNLVPSFSLRAVTTLAQFGVLVTLDRVLFFLYNAVDKVIGGRVLGKESLGLYAVALAVAAIPMEKILPIITQVSFAAFSRIQSDEERVRRNLLRSVQLVALICFPAFIGLAVVAEDFVPAVLGERWSPLVVPFQLICLVLPLKAVAALYAPALFGVGRPQVNVVNMLIALGVMTGALLVGVQYGVLGLCYAWLIVYPFVFLVITERSLRALGVTFARFFERLLFSVVASAAMAVLLLAVRGWLPAEAGWSRLLLMVTLGAASYGALLAAFQRATLRDLYHLVRS